jgi:anaerobic glycerol-3-phosphate dehydrogenase
MAVIVTAYGYGQAKDVQRGHAARLLWMAQPMKDLRTEAHLPSLDQLRNNAAECIRLAEAARSSAHKSYFIEMADRWLTLAERAAKTQNR